MNIDLGRGIYNNVEGLLLDDILKDHCSFYGRHAEDIDTCRPGSCCIPRLGVIAGDIVADDEVVVEDLVWSVAVHRDARLAIPDKSIVDNGIAIGLSTRNRGEHPCSRPSAVQPITNRVVVRNGVVIDAQGSSRSGERRRRMGSERDSAIEWIQTHIVLGHQIVMPSRRYRPKAGSRLNCL